MLQTHLCEFRPNVVACVGSNPMAYPVSDVDDRALDSLSGTRGISIGHSGGGDAVSASVTPFVPPFFIPFWPFHFGTTADPTREA
jgi:hypothetical protein